jgi:hypothetical protein
MKSLSASIIAGVACLHVASEISHSDTGTATFVMIVGIVLIGLGMFGWFRTLREP